MTAKNGRMIPCETCGTPKYYTRYRELRVKHHYCSTVCQNAGDKARGVDKTSNAHQVLREKGHYKRDDSYLKDDRNPAKSIEARQKISRAKLESNWMRGKFKHLSPSYRGGKVMYRGWDWKTTRMAAKRRDGHACVKCGMTEAECIRRCGQVLQVDHIVPYRISKDNSLKNLQTLCPWCHGEKEAGEIENYFSGDFAEISS